MADICRALYCYDKTASHPVDVSSGGAPALTYCGDGKVTQKKRTSIPSNHIQAFPPCVIFFILHVFCWVTCVFARL